MNRYTLLMLPVLVVSAGCARPKPDFSKLQQGMSEAQVIALLGKPSQVGLRDGKRILTYESWDRDMESASKINVQSYEVALVDDRVVSFGQFK